MRQSDCICHDITICHGVNMYIFLFYNADIPLGTTENNFLYGAEELSALADPRGVLGTRSPFSAQFLSFSCSLRQNLAK